MENNTQYVYFDHFFTGLIIGIVLGGIICFFTLKVQLQREAVEKGFAEYNSKTAEWQWKENKK